MATLHALMVEAAKAVRWRGHTISRWTKDGADKRRATRAYVECDKCGMRADVNTRPMPNEIDIGGEAVALGCAGERCECGNVRQPGETTCVDCRVNGVYR